MEFDSMGVAEHRECIDAIDAQIVALLNERASHALAIRKLKEEQHKPRFDAAREEELVSRLKGLNEGPLYGDNIEEIYEAILKVMKEF